MTHVRCDRCEIEGPAGTRFRVDERVLCLECAEREAAERSEAGVEPPSRSRIVDPTVCEFCDSDNGDLPYATLAGVPACDACADRMRRHPFPPWLKIAAALVAGLVVITFARNWRFVRAHVEGLRASRAFQAGDLATAAPLMALAASRAPEVQGLADAAAFFRGAELMSADRPAEALPWFRRAADHAPSDSDIQLTLLVAEAGAAFDARDYERFLDFAHRLAGLRPQDSFALQQVASAYACKYAVSGDEAFRRAALEHLQKASAIASDRVAYDEYAERINHRLATREVLRRRDYDRRFRAARAGGN